MYRKMLLMGTSDRQAAFTKQKQEPLAQRSYCWAIHCCCVEGATALLPPFISVSETLICDRPRFGLMLGFSDHMKTSGACNE